MHSSLRLQFFLVIVVIFAAEVAALAFGFIYHDKVGSRSWSLAARRQKHRNLFPLRVCPVKLRPGTLHDRRLLEVRRAGRRQQSRGVSADSGRCRLCRSVFSRFSFVLHNFFFFTLHLPLFTFISFFSAFSSFDDEGQL